MKILVLLSRLPYPLEKGDKLRAYHQLKYLNKKHEVTLICLTDKPCSEEHVNEVKKICRTLHVFPISRLSSLMHMVYALFAGLPFQVGYFFNLGLAKKIGTIIKETKPDHIYCQLIRMSEYVKEHFEVKKTLDYMDVFSKGIERRAGTAPLYLKPLLWWEFQRVHRYEKKIFDFFDRHTIISEQDRSFIPHFLNRNITVVPNGVDADFFSPRDAEKKYDVVFCGNMNYPPNIVAAEYLVNEVLPLLRSRGKNISVLLAGADPHKRIRDLASARVTVSGWMDDIRDAYASSRVFAAPMFINTGMQNKLLEAMSMGLPCVTTPLAGNAIGTTHNETILLRSDAEGFAQSIISLLENEELYRKISGAGRDFIVRKYSWDAANALLEHTLEG